MAKEIDMQIQEAQNPKQDGCKEAHPKPIIIKMPKFKGKERILKAARENQSVIYREVPLRLSAQKKLCRLEGIGKKYSRS